MFSNIKEIHWLPCWSCWLVTLPPRTQVRVYATDSGYPPRNTTQEARVILRVTRNRHTPQFTLQSYVATVPETLQTGGSVLDVSARDADSEVYIQQ